MDLTERAAPLVFGGLLIGVWLYFILFQYTDPGWTWWGVAGLVLGGAGYGARFAEPTLALGIWVGVGIVAGLAVTAAFVGQDATFLAAALTTAGAASIARAATVILAEEHGDDGSHEPAPAHTEHASP